MPDSAGSQRAAPHVLRQVGLWASIAPNVALGAVSLFTLHMPARDSEYAGGAHALPRDIDSAVAQRNDAARRPRAFPIATPEEYGAPERAAPAMVARRHGPGMPRANGAGKRGTSRWP